MAKRRKSLTSDELRKVRSLLAGVKDELRDLQGDLERRLDMRREAQRREFVRKARLRRLTFGLLGRS